MKKVEIKNVKPLLQQHNVSSSAVNLEEFLKQEGFEIDTYYQTNKRYRKEITDCQTLYVRIYSDVNTLQEIEYEHRAITKFEREGIISFETIDTLPKLKCLLDALS